MTIEAEETAEVILRHGRWHLVVHGVFVAMEGDICRDPLYGNTWSKKDLVDACLLIIKKRWTSASDRWNESHRAQRSRLPRRRL